MNIVFQSAKLQKILQDPKLLGQTYGPEMAKRINRRLTQLRDAANLAVLQTLPQGRCHELKGTRAGQLALDLVHPQRLVFEPANDPIPLKPDGGLDWVQVTVIRILEIVDYH